MFSSINPAQIVFAIWGWGVGGAENTLEKIIAKLLSRNTRVFLIIFSRKTKNLELLQLRNPNLNIVLLDIGGIFSAFCGLYKFILFVKKERPEVVQTWMYRADLIGGVILKVFFPQVRVIWGVRHGDPFSSATALKTSFLSVLCALTSWFVPEKIIFCSRSSMISHGRIGYRKSICVVVVNGFRVPSETDSQIARNNVRRLWDFDDTQIVVGFFGRYMPEKNHRGFLTALSIVVSTRDDVCAIIAGRGCNADNAELTHLICSLGLTRNVKLLGEVGNVYQCMSGIDLLVCASFVESFPNVVAEAMALGKICVVTGVGDSKEIVDRFGYITDLDPRSIVDGIRRAVRHITSNSRDSVDLDIVDHVKNKYSIDFMVEGYLKCWQSREC